MTLDEVIEYCLGKPGATESYPWGDEELVCKVGGKAFAFIGMRATVSLKCGPTAEAAAEWRERYPDAISISSYIGRYGWNKITLNGTVPSDEVRELLDTSYRAVVNNKRLRR